jgi:penicillin-binding protein 1A
MAREHNPVKWKLVRILDLMAAGVALFALLGAFGLSCCYVYLEPSLPSVDAMRTLELQVPLRVYTVSGDLIAQIGEERRIPVTYDQVPLTIKQAFLAAEDDRFFQHHGIDYLGLLRSIAVDIASGQKAQGGSTITMQAARNMFLSFDKTWRRKLQEAFLTYRMEHAFTKEQIFGLYLNVIFFGERAYGVAAAAQTFFGKSLNELSIAQVATLAGIPQAPSRYNPIANPEFAKARRHYVLRRMRELGYIDAATAAAANAAPIDASEHGPLYDVEAQYVAEMARLESLRLLGPSAETAGYKVYTTIDGRLQAAADRAVRLGLIEYDRRYGYRGPAGHADLASNAESEDFEEALDEYPAMSFLTPAVVVSVADRSAQVFVKAHGLQTVGWDGLSWARRSLNGEGVGPAPKSAHDVLARGDVIYVVTDDQHAAQLAQVPEAQAALVALDPTDGAVGALVGGFDYFANEYNRAVQARRQPGSGFKPFLYSAALEDGFTPASVLLDAPIVMDTEGLESVWRPENSHRDFRGPMRLREALVWSRNLVSVRLLRQMGLKYASDYVTRFGFDRQSLPQNLTLALGTLQVTPLELASAYATFANGGFRVQPYFIDHIEGPGGKTVWQAQPLIACAACEHPADLRSLGRPAGAPSAATGTVRAAVAGPSASSVTPVAPSAGALAGTGTGAGAVGPVPLAASSAAQGGPLQGMSAEQLLSIADGLRGGAGDLPAKRLAPRVISPQNDYLLTDMMADVIKHGTGQRALTLHRSDLAGKTGTTNESRDAWFNGFTRNLVATVWVGYDQERSLGETEEGSRTALPIWIYFMREALKGVPEEHRTMPDGLVTLRISPDTGMLASAENPDAILETFMVNHLPAAGTPGTVPAREGKEQTQSGDSLF